MRHVARVLAVGSLCLPLLAGCSPKPKAYSQWRAWYGDLKSCRAAEPACFEYFQIEGADPHVICDAESPYPAHPRRQQCYSVFGVKDNPILDPEKLLQTATTQGPDRLHATISLVGQMDHVPSQKAMLRMLLTSPFPDVKPQAAMFLAERGYMEAVDYMVDRLADPKTEDRADWLSMFTRIEKLPLGPHFLRIIERPSRPVDANIVDLALRDPTISPVSLLRSLFIGARPGSTEVLRLMLRERLTKEPRETLLLLARLLADTAVQEKVRVVLERVTGKRPELSVGSGETLVASLPAESLAKIQVDGETRRLLVAMPGFDDEATASASIAEYEARCYKAMEVEVTFVDRAGPDGALKVRMRSRSSASDNHCDDFGLIALVKTPGGQVQTLVGRKQERSILRCADDPRHCQAEAQDFYYPFTRPLGDPGGPMFATPGRYTVTFETPMKGVTLRSFEIVVPGTSSVARDP